MSLRNTCVRCSKTRLLFQPKCDDLACPARPRESWPDEAELRNIMRRSLKEAQDKEQRKRMVEMDYAKIERRVAARCALPYGPPPPPRVPRTAQAKRGIYPPQQIGHGAPGALPGIVDSGRHIDAEWE